MFPTGAYTAERAAALSGVPLAALRWWARDAILVPGVSAERTKLWSYTDLLALRVIYWLRQRETDSSTPLLSPISMQFVRRSYCRNRFCSCTRAKNSGSSASRIDMCADRQSYFLRRICWEAIRTESFVIRVDGGAFPKAKLIRCSCSSASETGFSRA